MTEPTLTPALLIVEAKAFAEEESTHAEATLFGSNDGKKVGTYLEQKFSAYLAKKYGLQVGNAALGIDLPSLNVDIKATSYKQPQSSTPFKGASQKIYGLGHHLLIFVYRKEDNINDMTSCLKIVDVIFIDEKNTADARMTTRILEILKRDKSKDKLMSLFHEHKLPLSKDEAADLAEHVIQNPPAEGFLTISPALQWRLSFKKARSKAGKAKGISKAL
jgi:hypothetical protein